MPDFRFSVESDDLLHPLWSAVLAAADEAHTDPDSDLPGDRIAGLLDGPVSSFIAGMQDRDRQLEDALGAVQRFSGMPTVAGSSGFGAAPTVAVTAGGSDQGFEVGVTAAAVPAAGPSVTVNWFNSHQAAPVAVVVTPGGTNAQALGLPALTAKTSTQVTFGVPGTAVAGTSYVWEVVAVWA